MKNILIITGRYLPGFKDGGPVRTIKNLTDMLGDKYHFTVACADRDHGDEKPYADIKVGAGNVNRVGKADVVYIENGSFSMSDIKTLSDKNDIVYVCGPYNGYAIKTLILNRLGKISPPVVLAPMGSFSAGALAIKSTKKQLFLKAGMLVGLYKNIYFSVTSEVEKEEMLAFLNKSGNVVKGEKIFVAQDPQRAPQNMMYDKLDSISKCDDKTNAGSDAQHTDLTTQSDVSGLQCVEGEGLNRNGGELRVVFLSRISEKKNLKGAAEILCSVKSKVKFDIYGTMEDKAYYDECKTVFDKLPDNVKYEYKGEADSECVPEILSNYDVFLFPTQGENFGHVISEALSAGLIPVISNTTPWLDFEEKNVGFVLPLEDIKAFADCIDKISEMPEGKRKELSDNAVKYYTQMYEESVANNGYINMFERI